jgi:hypothetical protein
MGLSMIRFFRAGAIGSGIRHWSPILLSVLSVSLLAIASVSPNADFSVGGHSYSWAPRLVVVGIALAVLSSLWLGARERKLQVLEHDNESLRRTADAGVGALLGLIRVELDRLRLEAGHQSNERVSLYRCENGDFLLVGRRSANPVFDRSSGRQRYPADEGCLGAAWQAGTAEESGLPNPGARAPWNRLWLTAQWRRHRVPESTAAAFSMQSRSYFAFRVDSADGALGVLVFESLNTSEEAKELAATRSPPTILSSADLEPLFKKASERLVPLLRESRLAEPDAVAEHLQALPNKVGLL